MRPSRIRPALASTRGTSPGIAGQVRPASGSGGCPRSRRGWSRPGPGRCRAAAATQSQSDHTRRRAAPRRRRCWACVRTTASTWRSPAHSPPHGAAAPAARATGRRRSWPAAARHADPCRSSTARRRLMRPCAPAPARGGGDTARAAPESPAADSRCRPRSRGGTHPPAAAHRAGPSSPHSRLSASSSAGRRSAGPRPPARPHRRRATSACWLRPPARCAGVHARRQRRQARRRSAGNRPSHSRAPVGRHRTRLEKRFVQIDSDVLISHGPSSSQPGACAGGTPMLPGLAERRPFHLITDFLCSFRVVRAIRDGLISVIRARPRRSVTDLFRVIRDWLDPCPSVTTTHQVHPPPGGGHRPIVWRSDTIWPR